MSKHLQVGVTGEYFVAYYLSSLELKVTLLHGGASDVDILACSADGSRVCSVQVKTARSAACNSWYAMGKGRKWQIRKDHSPSRDKWYALVDLNVKTNEQPMCIFVPSTWINQFGRDGEKMSFFHLVDSVIQQVQDSKVFEKYMVEGKPVEESFWTLPEENERALADKREE